MTWSSLAFWVLAAISVTSAIMMVANRNPVRSALFLVLAFCAQAVFYVTLSAQFIAAIQVIVYAGAIMVLFLFVIMLLNIGAPEALRERGKITTPIAVALGVVFIAFLGAAGSLSAGLGVPKTTPAFLRDGGTVEAVGKAMFDPLQPWLFPFEVTSILLLVGVVGSIALARRRD